MNVCLSWEIFYRELEKHKLLANYAGKVNYNFCACVKWMPGRAHTHTHRHAAPSLREHLLSDALLGVGVRAMDDSSTGGLEPLPPSNPPHVLLVSDFGALSEV